MTEIGVCVRVACVAYCAVCVFEVESPVPGVTLQREFPCEAAFGVTLTSFLLFQLQDRTIHTRHAFKMSHGALSHLTYRHLVTWMKRQANVK